MTETQKRAYLLANNQLALNAGWDMEMLRVELEGLRRSDFDLEVIGFDINELAEVFRDFDFLVAGLTDEDSAPEPPEKPISQPGDLWLLGNHRLLCADATQPGDVGRLNCASRSLRPMGYQSPTKTGNDCGIDEVPGMFGAVILYPSAHLSAA